MSVCTNATTGQELTADPRKYLVLINPVGGKGKGVHIFHTQIRPLFDLAEADCQVIITGNSVCGVIVSLARLLSLSPIYCQLNQFLFLFLKINLKIGGMKKWCCYAKLVWCGQPFVSTL